VDLQLTLEHAIQSTHAARRPQQPRMTRLTRAWGALAPEQRIAAVAAVAMLLTMFFPWYELQALNRRSGAIDSHSISAFGDVSFVEAAVFLVAAGVLALLFARAENRDFHLPGGDGGIVMIAGGWATLLIFYRVFSRPAGHGYPVGIQWGFFLAFVAAGSLAYAGWRMRATATPEPPLVRRHARGRPSLEEEDLTVVAPASPRPERAVPVPARASQSPASPSAAAERPEPFAATPKPPEPLPPPAPTARPSGGSRDVQTPPPAARSQRKRPRYPPAPSDQLSFEDQPASEHRPYHSPDDA
jgi:hypothetical protein